VRAANLFYGIGSGKTLELKQATVSPRHIWIWRERC